MYISEYSRYCGLPGWSMDHIEHPKRAQHDLAVVLSDIHLAYRGNCTYGLLCKQLNLRATGKLLMEHKLRSRHESLIKPNAGSTAKTNR